MPTPLRQLATLLVVALSLLCLAPAQADDSASVDKLLHRARHSERIQGDADEALRLYRQVADTKGADPAARGEALRAMARIHLSANRLADAERCWARITKDETLTQLLHDWARQQQADHRKVDLVGLTQAERDDRERKQRRDAELRRIKTALNAARGELDAGRFEAARRKVFIVLAMDGANEEANALLATIEAKSPDRDDMWRQLLQLLESQDIVEYDRVREEIERRRRAARVAFDREDWKEADSQYRAAIRQIDESGFLGLGGAVDVHSLDELRNGLIIWLRQAHEQGTKAGLSFEPEPSLPDLEARQGSLRSRALAFFSDVMRAPREGAERIQFFEFAPRLKRGREAKRSLSYTLADGIKADDDAGSLARARWAERWIRRHIGTGWTGPRVASGPRASRRGRLLVRLDNHIAAQCGEREQRRISQLQGDFITTPPALRIDVQIFAVTSAGAVGAAEALRLSAGARESGLDYVVQNQLLATCVRDVGVIKGVHHLGGARLSIDGQTSPLLAFTKLTAQHPAYLKFPSEPAEITIRAHDARYGLWLDLYAEDMAGRRSGPNKTPTSALSVRALVKQPNPTVPSHIVRQQATGGRSFTRLPLFSERVIEADRAVPHFGTFVLQGLPNPFPVSRAEFPELLVLIGTTREDTPTPDPPRAHKPDSPIVPADVLVRDYPIGPLSIDIDDQMIPGSWPTLRTFQAGVTAADRRSRRDQMLTDLLFPLAGIDLEGPGGHDAIVVQDHRATGTLDPDGHVRLQQALQKLRAHENDLYQVHIRTGVVGRERWQAWVARSGYTRNANGNYIIEPAAREALTKEFDVLAAEERLFAGREVRLTRATQQVAFVKLQTDSITKDYKVRRLADDTLRYTPVGGVVEQGVVVEVRPMLERDGATRLVRVRARAARIQSIDQRPYPQADRPEVVYDVARWHAGNKPSHSDTRDSELLADDAALLAPLPLPGSDTDRVVVLITVRKVQ